MGIYIRPFQKEDVKAFKPIEPIVKDIFEDEKFVQAVENSGLAVTGVRNGEVVACGGVHPTEDPNQGLLWLRLSEKCQDFKFDTARCLISGIRIIEETYPFRQLIAAVNCGYERGLKFIEKFGYKQIGIENGYYVYAKYIGD